MNIIVCASEYSGIFLFVVLISACSETTTVLLHFFFFMHAAMISLLAGSYKSMPDAVSISLFDSCRL